MALTWPEVVLGAIIVICLTVFFCVAVRSGGESNSRSPEREKPAMPMWTTKTEITYDKPKTKDKDEDDK